MKRFFNKIVRGEKGQALPIVLVLLVVGGLLIAPCLAYASTSLRTGHAYEQKLNEIYAADAGAEYALWQSKQGTLPTPGTEVTLPQKVNDITVKFTTAREPVPFRMDIHYHQWFHIWGPIWWLRDNAAGIHLWNKVIGDIDRIGFSHNYDCDIIISNLQLDFGGNPGTPKVRLTRMTMTVPQDCVYDGASQGISTDPPDVDGQDLTWYFPDDSGPIINYGEVKTQSFHVRYVGGGSPPTDGNHGLSYSTSAAVEVLEGNGIETDVFTIEAGDTALEVQAKNWREEVPDLGDDAISDWIEENILWPIIKAIFGEFGIISWEYGNISD